MAFVFDKKRPPLVAMVQDDTVANALDTIVDSHYDGADAFGIQLEDLRPEFRTAEQLNKLFAACYGKPIYITSYRCRESKGLTDDECMELLLKGVENGADLADVMGDLYDPQPHELTENPEAVAKQKALIEKIHSMGGQVLMSCHTHTCLPDEEVIRYALAQKERGADVVKIVNECKTEADYRRALNLPFKLKDALGDTPFLFLTSGVGGRVIRQIGPQLGVCMYLCAVRHKPGFTNLQPLLRAMKQVRDHLIFMP